MLGFLSVNMDITTFITSISGKIIFKLYNAELVNPKMALGIIPKERIYKKGLLSLRKEKTELDS